MSELSEDMRVRLYAMDLSQEQIEWLGRIVAHNEPGFRDRLARSNRKVLHREVYWPVANIIEPKKIPEYRPGMGDM